MSSHSSQKHIVLDVIKIAENIDRLRTRIHARFPNSNLYILSQSVTEVAKETGTRARNIRKPKILLRSIIAFLVIIVFGGVLLIVQAVVQNWRVDSDIVEITQGLDATVSLLIVLGAALWFSAGLEERIKRSHILRYLHELRLFAHAVDMHQLTLDPHAIVNPDQKTSVSPARDMTEYELIRYLDYCSEMLSLVGKLSALYTEDTSDSEVIDAVNDIENLATNLSRKVWQKIMVLSSIKKNS